MVDKEEFEKVILEVNDDLYGVTGERVWAKALGDDLYEIRNTPWHTCDVSWGDVVRAVPEKENQWPKVLEVVRRSGNRTVHIFFLKAATDTDKAEILGKLKTWKANYENADGKLYAVDVAADGDFDGLCQYLHEVEDAGMLDYRTGVSPPAV